MIRKQLVLKRAQMLFDWSAAMIAWKMRYALTENVGTALPVRSAKSPALVTVTVPSPKFAIPAQRNSQIDRQKNRKKYSAPDPKMYIA